MRTRCWSTSQYPLLAPPPPELPPPKLLDPDEPRDDDEELESMRGSTFVYSRVKLQNAHDSTTRALPLLAVVAAASTVSLDDFVRLRHCGHFSNLLIHFGYRSVK